MRFFYLLFLSLLLSISINAQITITPGGTATSIINCDSVAYGSFSGNLKAGDIRLSNGVVVHNSVGVEGVVLQTSEKKESVSSGIETWSLDICLQFFEHVKSKLAIAPTQEEALKYELKLKQIEERILVLKTQK